MIDIEKMKALAARLRYAADIADDGRKPAKSDFRRESADAIDSLLSELEAANRQLTVPEWAEGDEQAWDKVTPAVAWHLIERHGENWAHIDRLMQAYLDAQTAKLRAELEAREADRRRLDCLDQMNVALNKHYGTQYGWKLILSPNIARLMSGRHHAGFVGDIDLNDANSGLGSFDSCRKAIDEALTQRQEGEEK